MKKISKGGVIAIGLGAIGGMFVSLLKERKDLKERLSMANDLIWGQDSYIWFIRHDMSSGMLSYNIDKFGSFAKDSKHATERCYNESVKPLLDKWVK